MFSDTLVGPPDEVIETIADWITLERTETDSKVRLIGESSPMTSQVGKTASGAAHARAVVELLHRPKREQRTVKWSRHSFCPFLVASRHAQCVTEQVHGRAKVLQRL